MPLGSQSYRSKIVERAHLSATREAVGELSVLAPFLIGPSNIDELAERSGDTYIWHMDGGAVYDECALLRVRMDEAGIGPTLRLAHGALGVVYALRTAYTKHPDIAIRGVRDVRFSVPVFEGAGLSASIEITDGETGTFEVTTDQLEHRCAISGQLLYGTVLNGHYPDIFFSLPEQQLFSLEEAVGLVSALLGMWVQESGGRALYMSQSLELGGLVSVGDTLEAMGDVARREPSKRVGEKIAVDVLVRSREKLIASGESLILYGEDGLWDRSD
jgi:acyl dehydratase